MYPEKTESLIDSSRMEKFNRAGIYENYRVMKRIADKASVLKIIYLVLLFILVSLLIYTPTLINGPVKISRKLIVEEETIEGIFLFILFIMSILIFNLYQREVLKHKEIIEKINTDKKKVEERLTNSEQYIGILNVQIEQIKSIFNGIDKYPQTKGDLKKSFSYFSKNALGIVNTSWVLFRIINNLSQRTIIEHFASRNESSSEYPHVSNKMIVENHSGLPFNYVISNPKNLNILAICIMPVDHITKDQHVFIQAIINEIIKLFVIVNSAYYIKDNKLFTEDKADKKYLSSIKTK
jgi:hypothetical protein